MTERPYTAPSVSASAPVVELVRRQPRGQVYPISSFAGWLRETGFERIERTDLTRSPPITLVRARRA